MRGGPRALAAVREAAQRLHGVLAGKCAKRSQGGLGRKTTTEKKLEL